MQHGIIQQRPYHQRNAGSNQQEARYISQQIDLVPVVLVSRAKRDQINLEIDQHKTYRIVQDIKYIDPDQPYFIRKIRNPEHAERGDRGNQRSYQQQRPEFPLAAYCMLYDKRGDNAADSSQNPRRPHHNQIGPDAENPIYIEHFRIVQLRQLINHSHQCHDAERPDQIAEQFLLERHGRRLDSGVHKGSIKQSFIKKCDFFSSLTHRKMRSFPRTESISSASKSTAAHSPLSAAARPW